MQNTHQHLSRAVKNRFVNIKERFTIPHAWIFLGLPGHPGKSVSSPFRADHKASFSVFQNGMLFKDHATGEMGDVVDFVSLALKLNKTDAIGWLLREPGLSGPQSGPRLPSHRQLPEADPSPRGIDFPADMRPPLKTEIDHLAQLRGLGRVSVKEAVDRNLLFVGTMRDGDSDPEVPSWILTDSARRNAQARRLDGIPWKVIGAKAKTLRGSKASWPVGLGDAKDSERSAVVLVEGGPDLLAALHLLFHAGIPLKEVTVAAMFGATQGLCLEAVKLLEGHQVWILPHGDTAGGRAVTKWAAPLLGRGGQVHVFRVTQLGYRLPCGSEVKDLNDLCRVACFAGEPPCLRRCQTLCDHFNLAPLAEKGEEYG